MHLNELLGIRMVRKHRDGVTLECQSRPGLLNHAGGLHGGVIATMADAAVGHAIAHHFRERRPVTTTEMKINYLRPIAGNGKLIARARLVRVGKTLCVGTVEMFDSHKNLAAVAIVTYMLLPKGTAG